MDRETIAQIDPTKKDEADVTGAKARFIDSAARVDPLKTVREHPYLLLSVAAAIGAVAGSIGGKSTEANTDDNAPRASAASRFAGVATLLQPLLMQGVRSLATAWMAHRAAQAVAENGNGTNGAHHADEPVSSAPGHE